MVIETNVLPWGHWPHKDRGGTHIQFLECTSNTANPGSEALSLDNVHSSRDSLRSASFWVIFIEISQQESFCQYSPSKKQNECSPFPREGARDSSQNKHWEQLCLIRRHQRTSNQLRLKTVISRSNLPLFQGLLSLFLGFYPACAVSAPWAHHLSVPWVKKTAAHSWAHS